MTTATRPTTDPWTLTKPATHYHIECRWQLLRSWRTSTQDRTEAIQQLLGLIQHGRKLGLSTKRRTYRNETTVWSEHYGQTRSVHQTYTHDNGLPESDPEHVSAQYVIDTCNMYSCEHDQDNPVSFAAYLAECEEAGMLTDTQSVAVLGG